MAPIPGGDSEDALQPSVIWSGHDRERLPGMFIRPVYISLLRIGAGQIDQQRGTPLYARRLKQPQGVSQGHLSLLQEKVRLCIIRMIQVPEADALIACQSRTIKVEPVPLFLGIGTIFDLLSCIKRPETRFTIAERGLYFSFYCRQIGSNGVVDALRSQSASLLNTPQSCWRILAVGPGKAHPAPCDSL